MDSNSGKTYLYMMLYNELKESIQRGRYTEGTLLPSESELGKAHGVDRTTVRKALQLLVEEGLVVKHAGKGSVVTDGKAAHAAAKAPAGQNAPAQGKSIAFLLPKSTRNNDRITQPFYASLFYTIEQECQKHGYQLQYSTINAQDDYNSILEDGRYTGIIFVSNVQPSVMDSAVAKGIPSVLVNSWYEGVPSILSDNFNGTRQACEYLISQGHAEIGVLKGIEEYATTQERLNGCLVALARAGLQLKPEYTLQGEWDYDSGNRAVAEMLKKVKKPPTAIVAFNDHLALGAISAITAAGLSVPGDISVVGFDNLEQTRYLQPSLTTVDINPGLIGRVATSRLWEQINGGTCYPVKVLTPVSLVIRNSVQKHRKK